MGAVSAEEIKKILVVIDKATQMHSEWYEDLMRRLLCKLPLPESEIGINAYHCCDFGRWFYGRINKQGHDVHAIAD